MVTSELDRLHEWPLIFVRLRDAAVELQRQIVTHFYSGIHLEYRSIRIAGGAHNVELFFHEPTLQFDIEPALTVLVARSDSGSVSICQRRRAIACPRC